MIACLIHCSLVWLTALLVYEIWLRRTTFHSANRWYLNTSLALGLLLPLYQTEVTRPDFVPVLEQPMHQLAVRQQQIEVIGQNAGKDLPLSSVLLAIALAGAAFQMLRLIREGIVLLRWRRHAVRSELLGYMVFLTGAQHGPFSAFGAIYLSSIDAYTEKELRFILTHERAHLKHRHSIDKTFVLLLRCLLWWHPLVYVYYSRLSLVQEFQADQALKQQAPAYGRFLIDESMAVGGVSITHQFYHSPLKTRIRMLQRFATRNWQKAGYVAALALLAGGSFLWTNKSLAHKEERDGNIITFNGNKFEIGYPQMAGKTFPKEGIQIRLVDPPPAAKNTTAAGQSDTVVTSALSSVHDGDKNKTFTVRMKEKPVKMNGQPILSSEEVDQQAAFDDGGQNILKSLIESQIPSLAKLTDGSYNLKLANVIVDANGSIVYYENGGVSWYVSYDKMPGNSMAAKAAAVHREEEKHQINPTLSKQISVELEASLERLKLKPATKSGKPVVAYAPIHERLHYYIVKVQDGKVTAENIVH
jgi:hypothetical protein